MKEQIMKSIINLREELCMLRAANHLTQKQVAEQLGITHQSYQAYESGETVPTLQNFVKLALIFDVSTDFLLGLKDY